MQDPRPQTPLAARSPFELRVNLGRDVPEADVRAALANGDMGFLHSFTTGSTVDGPGVRVVAWTTARLTEPSWMRDADSMKRMRPAAMIGFAASAPPDGFTTTEGSSPSASVIRIS